jgi:capsular exopolysaccharide synthesis family protein
MLFKRKRRAADDGEARLCEELDFAATEAYKLLRTNLFFTLSDMDKPCHVVGITSSVRGEGKSTTAINLSYALAMTGKRVLLIDGDLRLPTIAKKLHIPASKGVSDVLLDPKGMNEALYMMKKYPNWHILTSGSLPPNPAEMLGSAQMAKLVKTFSESYDFIVIDLPPVNIVSDALIVTPILDGMIVVVRQDYSTRSEVNQCEKQLELSGVKILGFVISNADSGSSSYKYKYKYRYKKDYSYRADAYARTKKEQK